MRTLHLAKREEIGSSCVFARLMKRLEKDLRVRTRKCMLKSISYFFSVHEIDSLSNISMYRTLEQLAENLGEKKELSKELK